MSVVSLAWIPVKKDAEGSAGAKTLGEMKEKILSTPGLTHSYHGKGQDPDEPASIEIFDVWSSLDAAKTAAASPEAAAAKAAFGDLVDTSNPKHQPYHNIIVFDKDFAPVAESPVVHLTALFLPLDVNVAEFEATWKNSVKGSDGIEGLVAGAAGWGQDDVEFPDGKKKVFLATAGWKSIDAAKAVADKAKEDFKELAAYTQHTQIRFTVLTKNK